MLLQPLYYYVQLCMVMFRYSQNASDQKRTLKAAHGYDNELMSMKAFFYAMGPDILPQVQIQEFRQVITAVVSSSCKT